LKRNYIWGYTNKKRLNTTDLEHLCGHVTPSVGNITEEKSHAFNEISNMASLVPIRI
jgi:hypothetical protein